MRGYLGFLSFFKVLGRWKVTDVRIFLVFFLKLAPDLTALAVFKACAFGSAFFELSAASKLALVTHHITLHTKINRKITTL